MAFKFSRKAFLTGGAAGVGLMALNVCGASAAAPAAAEQENCLNVLASKLTNVKVSQLSGLPVGSGRHSRCSRPGRATWTIRWH